MKTFLFWSAVLQFIGMLFGYAFDAKFLFYWGAFWTAYSVIVYFSYGEGK